MIYLGGLFLALVVLGGPVAIIALIVGQGRLRRRVQELESRVDALAQRKVEVADLSSDRGADPMLSAPSAQSQPTTEQNAGSDHTGAAPATAQPAKVVTAWPGLSGNAESSTSPPVTRPDRIGDFSAWLRDNWVYAVSAVSLGLAGVFLVQYGAEQGLLPPSARVLLALALGAGLIGAGEWVRRRHGDAAANASAYVPSVFSGAGIICMFAGILAARQLYGLIGAELAFAGLLGTAVVAIVLGWFYGPVLAGVGLAGAGVVPFLVGGDAESASWLYAYFALIAAAGLAVDAVRRWGWVSVLALAVGYGGGAALFLVTSGLGGWAMLLAALPFLTVALPQFTLNPTHQRPMITEVMVHGHDTRLLSLPVRLAGGAVALSVLGLFVLTPANATEAAVIYASLAVLALGLLFWTNGAPGLADVAALPALGFIARLLRDGLNGSPLIFDPAHLGAAAPMVPAVTALLLAAGAMTLAFGWRGLKDRDFPILWGLAAAVCAPLAAVILDVFWAASDRLGTYPWALHVIALAAVLTGVAIRFARHDQPDKRRAAYGTLATLSLIALALFLVATKTALTLALGVLIVVAAALDRRFRLPEMSLFISAGLAVLTWRLVVDPGLGWAAEAPIALVLASFGGASIAALAARVLLADTDRPYTKAELGIASWSFLALLANVLIGRWLQDLGGADWQRSHWALALQALPWLTIMLWRLSLLPQAGRLRPVAVGVIGFAATLAAIPIGFAALWFNPLLGDIDSALQYRVFGPPVLDTLALAFGLPGLILLFAAPRLPQVRGLLRLILALIGAALCTIYVGLEIRRFWRGDDLWIPGVTQPELYSYTVALILTGAALLYHALSRGSDGWRRVAMAVIAVTVAKVFLIDASGLTGLTRVFSFLGLGFSLAGLAWLNRWAATRSRPEGTDWPSSSEDDHDSAQK
jgi:uncharacterized membrane protein